MSSTNSTTCASDRPQGEDDLRHLPNGTSRGMPIIDSVNAITGVSRRIGELTRKAVQGDVVVPFMLVYLCPQELCAVAITCSSWREAADNNGLWERWIDMLWLHKDYVAQRFLKLRESGELKSAYFESLRDSTRTFLTTEELFSFDWAFRFKDSAGPGWTDQDPWFQNKDASTAKFSADGTLRRVSTAGTLPPMVLQWRFVQSIYGMQQYTNLPRGSLIRASVNGLDVPTYVVSRSPTGNWGFVLDSCWAQYTSFKMPARGECPELEREVLTVDQQWEEAMRFNMGIPNHHAEMTDVDGASLLRIVPEFEPFEEDQPL